MKANISTVGKNLTLGRGITLNSTEKNVINFISDPLTINSLTNARASGFVYKNLQGQPFISDTVKSISYLKHYFNHSIRFFNSEDNQTLVSAGTFGTALTELTINVSTLNPSDVYILEFSDSTLSDPEDTFEVNVQATTWPDFVLYINSYFINTGYNHPYQVSYANGQLTIKNIYNVATLYTVSLTKLSESTASYMAFVSDSDLPENFFEFSDSIAIIKEGLTLGTTPDQDMIIGSYSFIDDDEIELASVRAELDSNGVIKICLRAKNLTDPTNDNPDGTEVNEEIALYIAKDGTVWATAPDPVELANGNEIATARWVRRVMAGGVIYKGPFDASVGNYNAISNSQVGWMYVITNSGVIGGVDWQIGDFLIVDQAGAARVTKIDNTESADLVKLDAVQTLTNKTLTSPTLTGTPTTPTAATGTSTTQIASTAFVANELTALKNGTFFVKTGDVDQDIDGIKSYKKYINRKLQSYSPIASSNVVDYIYKVVDASNNTNIAVESGVNRDTINSAVRFKHNLYNVNIGAATNFAGYDFVVTDTKGYYLEYTPENNTYSLGIPARDSSNKVPSTSWIQSEISYAVSQVTPATATSSSLGIVQPDNETINITSSGVISVPTATASTLGLVQPDGTSIVIDANGVLSATASIPSGGLTNTATGNNSLTILGSPAAANSAINIGTGSAVSSNSSIALGYNAVSSAANNIQLGTGTNSTTNTFQVGTYNLLDLSTGLIPDARLNLIDTTTNKIKSSYIDASAIGSNFVTLTGAQNILGAKNFQSGITVYNSSATKGTNPSAQVNTRLVMLCDGQGTVQDANGLASIQHSTESNGNTKLSFLTYKNTANSLLNSALSIVYEKSSDKTYVTLSATPDAGDVSTKIATTEFIRNYKVPVTTISSTSGSVTLDANNIYKISADGNMAFTLTTPTDSTVYNQIKIMLQTTNTPAIVWGTNKFYNNEAPDLSIDGNYSVYFDWDANLNDWVCGSLYVPNVI